MLRLSWRTWSTKGLCLDIVLEHLFFSDVDGTIVEYGWILAKFVDDLNFSRNYPVAKQQHIIDEDFKMVKKTIHKWGSDSRVSYDVAREEQVILHHREGVGSSFRFLGPLIDCRLLMHEAVAGLIKRARPKVRMRLR